MGTSAGSRYESVETLGKGGMGIVDLVRDQLLERRVARKVCLLDDADGRTRFVREARIGSLLDHPNIAPIYDAGQDDRGQTYFTMKYVEGQSLAELLGCWYADKEMAAEYPLRRRLGLFARVLEGVAYAHSRGVIHRDLKPGNIVIGEFGEVLVVDWGLAKRLGEPEEATRGHVAVDDDAGGGGGGRGTGGYLAPEQARGEIDRLGPASDVYALGTILYELLSGVRMFMGGAPHRVHCVIHGLYRPLHKVCKDAPRAVIAVANKALEAEPERRYPDAGAMLADVQALLDDRPPSVYRERLGERVARLTRRHAGALATATVVLLMIATALGIAGQAARDRAEAEAGLAVAETRRTEAERRRADAERVTAEKERERGTAMRQALALREERDRRAQARMKALPLYLLASNSMTRYVNFRQLQEVVVPSLKEAVRHDPTMMDAHLLLIRAQLLLQRPQAAALCFPGMFAGMSKSERELMSKVLPAMQLALLTGQAAPLPKELEAHEPEHMPRGMWRGLIATVMVLGNQIDRALPLLDELVRDPATDTWELQVLRVSALLRARRWRRAREVASQELRRYPGLQALLYLRAEAAYRAGAWQAAFSDIEVMLRADPSCYAAMRLLAQLERSAGRNLRQAKRPGGLRQTMASVRHFGQAALLGSPQAVRGLGPAIVGLGPWLTGVQADRSMLLRFETWTALERGLAAEGGNAQQVALGRAELAKLIAWVVASDPGKLAARLGGSTAALTALRGQLLARYRAPARDWLKAVRKAAPPASVYGGEVAWSLVALGGGSGSG